MLNFAHAMNHEATMFVVWCNSLEEKSIHVLEILLFDSFSFLC